MSAKDKEKGFRDELISTMDIDERISDLLRFTREMGCVEVINGERPIWAFKEALEGGYEFEQITPANSLDSWIAAMQSLCKCYGELTGRLDRLQQLKKDIEDLSTSLCNSYPAEYDSEAFYKAWAYQCNLKGKPKHWSIPVLNKEQMSEYKPYYDRCRSLFDDLTEGLETHNFKIITAYKGDYAKFSFTCEGVPGELEIQFPTTDKHLLVQECAVLDCRDGYVPMQMYIAFRFHDAIPIIDRFFGYTHHLKDIKSALKQFVKKEEWRGMLHRKFVIGRDDKGDEITTEEVPESYKELVAKSIAKASVEKDSEKEGDKK